MVVPESPRNCYRRSPKIASNPARRYSTSSPPGRRGADRGYERRQECRRIFLSVGVGEIYHIRWIGDKENPVPAAIVGSKIECWDCRTWIEIKRTGI
jgi:hypothetical protein